MTLPELTGKSALHRAARVNYLPRVISFIAVFIGILLLAPVKDLGVTSLVLAAACFLLYPHLALLHARIVTDSRYAEKTNLIIDSVLLGLWSAALGFNLWLTFMVFSASTLNGAVVGGPKHMALSAGVFCVSAALWALWAGVQFEPTYTTWFSALIAVFTVSYIAAVGLLFYSQHRELLKAHTTIRQNSDIFRSLLKLDTLSSDAVGVEELTGRALDHFERDCPGLPFGVLLFHKERTGQLIHADFCNLDPVQQDRIVRQVSKSGEYYDPFIVTPEPDRSLLAVPMGRHLHHATGYLVISKDLANDLSNVLHLFVDRIASAAQNALLIEELRKSAEIDSMTGLYRRAYFEERLARAIRRRQDFPSADFSIILFDVIGLKKANDEYCHQAGDQLLTTMAERLIRASRDSDVVARLGGDEFVVLLPMCPETDVEEAVQRLLGAIVSQPVMVTLPDGRGVELPARISVGAAGSDRHEPNRVLSVADARMYEDKARYYESVAESPR